MKAVWCVRRAARKRRPLSFQANTKTRNDFPCGVKLACFAYSLNIQARHAGRIPGDIAVTDWCRWYVGVLSPLPIQQPPDCWKKWGLASSPWLLGPTLTPKEL